MCQQFYNNLASFGSAGPPAEAREEILLSLGDLGTLPLSELLTVDQGGEDGQHQAVSHVQDTYELVIFNYYDYD